GWVLDSSRGLPNVAPRLLKVRAGDVMGLGERDWFCERQRLLITTFGKPSLRVEGDRSAARGEPPSWSILVDHRHTLGEVRFGRSFAIPGRCRKAGVLPNPV